MTVSVHFTKIEIVEKGTVIVSASVRSDLGVFKVDIPILGGVGDPYHALRSAREQLAKFGNELLNVASSRDILLDLPPET